MTDFRSHRRPTSDAQTPIRLPKVTQSFSDLHFPEDCYTLLKLTVQFVIHLFYQLVNHMAAKVSQKETCGYEFAGLQTTSQGNRKAQRNQREGSLSSQRLMDGEACTPLPCPESQPCFTPAAPRLLVSVCRRQTPGFTCYLTGTTAPSTTLLVPWHLIVGLEKRKKTRHNGKHVTLASDNILHAIVRSLLQWA